MAKVLEDGEYKDQITVEGDTYLGEQSITMDGTSKAATLPAGTNSIAISAETAAVRFSVNGTASANSGGYVPVDQQRNVYKLANLTSLALFGVAGAIAHLIYYKQP